MRCELKMRKLTLLLPIRTVYDVKTRVIVFVRAELAAVIKSATFLLKFGVKFAVAKL